ncbi:Putative O-methyltransferase domain, S-adenosyl-L-methionine-dependent methyltransferase superfamily [Colletotrichum destructivum]|uniref:O-methyltransferase domain, S-adenosyl-L-methionine-dependent methyltransferase superfamily n=1 Tax=Colletotrichum destructivum TaxID=34406 RepID=A0AAX4I2I4_9PEZI|nr:Putative O-methyltransferase domain, S-adenosyl-L-methionine-dependent methyltransferase superfamily [Colletotrichum destructivum]
MSAVARNQIITGATPEAAGYGRDAEDGFTSAQAFFRVAEGTTQSTFQNEEERGRAVLAVQDLLGRLESPWETYIRTFLTPSPIQAALWIMRDLKLFEKWNNKGNEAMTSAQLAELVGGVDPAFLHRILRLLVTHGILRGLPYDKLKPTDFCLALTRPEFHALMNHCRDVTDPLYAQMPAIAAEMGYINPTDHMNTFFQKAFNWEGDMWSYFKQNKDQGEAFNTVQRAASTLEPSWTDIFPISALKDGSDEKLPLFVDVSGGAGHDIRQLFKACPETASRLYLQDLDNVLNSSSANATAPTEIQQQVYDFFTPQPVKYARAYYLHHVIHDWSDEPARKILKMQMTAMKAGYSKLLIHDQILDDEKIHPHSAAYDIGVMAFLGAQERTQREWNSLLDSVGLRVAKVWKSPGATYGIIEAELP